MATEQQHRESIRALLEIKDKIEFISTKQDAMERRQCDAEAQATDAIRMAEAYVRGEHANLTESSCETVVKMIVDMMSPEASRKHVKTKTHLN